MRAREMKDGVYGQFARIGKAVSAPKRIELLELLRQGRVMFRVEMQLIQNSHLLYYTITTLSREECLLFTGGTGQPTAIQGAQV